MTDAGHIEILISASAVLSKRGSKTDPHPDEIRVRRQPTGGTAYNTKIRVAIGEDLASLQKSMDAMLLQILDDVRSWPGVSEVGNGASWMQLYVSLGGDDQTGTVLSAEFLRRWSDIGGSIYIEI